MADSQTLEYVTRQWPIIPQAQRLEWAKQHALTLLGLLDSPAKSKHTPGRLWRTRFFQEDDFTVVTLTQSLIPPPGVPSDQAVKIQVYVTRPYTRVGLSGGAVMQMQLAGQYSVDELVAFLRLDTLDPATVEWRDETRYSEIAVVRDVLQAHGARVQ